VSRGVTIVGGPAVGGAYARPNASPLDVGRAMPRAGQWPLVVVATDRIAGDDASRLGDAARFARCTLDGEAPAGKTFVHAKPPRVASRGSSPGVLHDVLRQWQSDGTVAALAGGFAGPEGRRSRPSAHAG
jgi:hypothetical protein